MDILEDFAIPENDGALHRLKNIVLILIGIDFLWWATLVWQRYLNNSSPGQITTKCCLILGGVVLYLLQVFLVYKRKRWGWLIVMALHLLDVNYLLLSVLWKMYKKYALWVYHINWALLIYLVPVGICTILLQDQMMHYFKIKSVSRALVIVIVMAISMLLMYYRIIAHWPLIL